MTPRARDEAGVGMIELLVAITASAILATGIGGAIYFGFHTTGDTQTRLIEANGARVLASFFVPDVQGAVAARPDTTDLACGAAAQPSLLVLTTNSDPETTISYYLGSGANSTTLYRRICAGGVPTATGRVAQNVTSAQFQCGGAGCDVVSGDVAQNDSGGRVPVTTRVSATRRATS